MSLRKHIEGIVEKLEKEADSLLNSGAAYHLGEDRALIESKAKMLKDILKETEPDEDAQAVWQWQASFGRTGDLEGVFVARPSQVKADCGKHAFFGEVLGKHSQVSGYLEEKDFKMLSQEPEMVAFVRKHGPFGFDSPLNYVKDQCKKCVEGADDPDMVEFLPRYEFFVVDGKFMCYKHAKAEGFFDNLEGRNHK